MKIIFHVILFLYFVTTQAFAQINDRPGYGRSAFSDASTIISDPSANDEILSLYFKDQAALTAFLTKYGFDSKTLAFQAGFTTASGGEADTHGFGDVPVFSDPKLGIDALGTFIAGRFKQEINVAFLDKFKRDLQSLPYLGDFFPKSKEVLQNSDPYNYPVFLETLRQAFEEDLNNLPSRLPDVIGKINPGKKPEATILLTIALTPSSVSNIVKALNSLSDQLLAENPQSTNDVLRKGVYTLTLVANAMYSLDKPNKIFISGTESDWQVKGFPDKYSALLIRQNELLLGSLVPKAPNIITLVKRLIPVYEALGNQATAIATQAKNAKVTPETVQQSIDVLLTTLKESVSAYKAFDPSFDDSGITLVINTGYASNKIARLIIEKKYGLALLDAITLVDAFASSKLTPEQKVKLNRYLSFITNVLSAEDKSDIVEALETSANPVGSYRVKRNSTFNISLNSYAGGFYGSDFNGSSVFGFTAPIGVYFGWGNLCKGCKTALNNDKGTSVGFIVTVIDVGAVAAFRLKDDKTEIADVSWNNVFAPGTYLTVGFPKCPISLNVGGQVGPEVRSIDNTGAVLLEKNQWYWRAAVTIDIPFFDLYIKQKGLE